MKLLLIGCLAVLLATKAFSATSSTLQLKGTIASVLDVAIATEAAATALPLETSQSNLKVGTVTTRSNSQTGYKVTISSTNNGKLKFDATNFVAYTLTFDGKAVNLAGQAFVYSFVNAAPVDRDVKISYSAAPNSLKAGDYVDTVTFTIGVN